MKRAVIIDAVRSPIARAAHDTGWLRDVRSDELSAQLIQALIQRTGIDPKWVEDVRWGCVQQQGEQGFDIARIAALLAGLPTSTAGVTINRNCASSLQALNDATMSIVANHEDVQIVGGVEHMGHIPMEKDYNPSPKLFHRHGEGIMQMGLTAEFLALKYRISRDKQDEFALRSHMLAATATDQGAFANEVIPVWGRDEQGRKVKLQEDQCIRRDTSLEALQKLPPVFNPQGGSVTAGNSSPLNVGAAALLVMSEAKAQALQLKPMARVVASAVVGVDPEEMGIGPAPAIQKALQRAGLTLDQIDCIEINEAFAVQVLTVLKLLGLDEQRVNTRGGAIALGHPLGASGARIATTLVHRLQTEGGRFGIASLCVGQGQGVATILERCD